MKIKEDKSLFLLYLFTTVFMNILDWLLFLYFQFLSLSTFLCSVVIFYFYVASVFYFIFSIVHFSNST